MIPTPKEPNEKQLAYTADWPYRMFLHQHEDGSQTLITVWHDLHCCDMTIRPDKYATWSAPVRIQEIWE